MEYESMIPYPQRHSEAEVQFTLVKNLRNAGIDARAEVRCGNSRPDVVVFDDDRQAVCIVEVKNYIKDKPARNKKQMAKYSQFGLPQTVCINMDDIPRSCQFVLDCMR